MRRFLTSVIDNETKKEILFSDISESESYWEIAKKAEITDSIKVGKMLEVFTPTRKFWYDCERRLLLGE